MLDKSDLMSDGKRLYETAMRKRKDRIGPTVDSVYANIIAVASHRARKGDMTCKVKVEICQDYIGVCNVTETFPFKTFCEGVFPTVQELAPRLEERLKQRGMNPEREAEGCDYVRFALSWNQERQ